MHTLEELANPALLSLAAKKVYRFLDRHSWYFDRAEAASFLGRLSFNIWLLSEELIAGKYKPGAKQLLAAPKKILKDENGATEYIVRPLASYPFRDQIVETALLCIYADTYEQLSGNIHTPRYPQNVSFGNRLHTSGPNLDPEFSVGSSKVYRDWSEDYTSFVQGTERAFNDALQNLQQHEQVTLLCCDIKSFYPNIRRTLIVQRLAASADDGLREVIGSLFGRYSVAGCDGIPEDESARLSSKGLPQGGVHSGFWANVYLSEFDRWTVSSLEAAVRSEIPGFRLCYFARYVDDMRLIGRYRLPAGPRYKRAHTHPIYKTISAQLKAIGLRLSPEKSQLIQQKEGGPLLTTGQIAERMHTIHQRLYAPLPPEDLEELLKDLRILFHADIQPIAGQSRSDLEPHLDNPGVRKDSRWRFSVGRWLRVAKELESLKPGSPKSGHAFSSEIVRRWLERPEQVQLLLYALKIGIGPRERLDINRKMRLLANERGARGYYLYLVAFFLDQASKSEIAASSLNGMPLQMWAINALKQSGNHQILVNKARQFLLTRANLQAYHYPLVMRGKRDGYCDLLEASTRGLKGGRLHPSEIASIYAFHSFRKENRNILITNSLERSDPLLSKKLLRQLLLSFTNREILDEFVLSAQKLNLTVPELAVFRQIRNRRSPEREELLLTAIRRGTFTSPLAWCRLARELVKVIDGHVGARRGARGLLHPESLVWSDALGLRYAKNALPRLAFAGYKERFNALAGRRNTPTWCLPVGMLLHAAATRDQRVLMGLSSSQRFRTLCTFRTLLSQGAMIPEAAGKIITRLYSWPGSRISAFSGVAAFRNAAEQLEDHLKLVTLTKPLSTTLCDVEGGHGQTTASRFTVVICQVPSHPNKVTDITVRRALSVARLIGREHGGGSIYPRLVVFPELSVPVASLNTLARFVSVTGALVLAGLELRTDTTRRNHLNELIWIVPGSDGDQRPIILRQHKIHITKDESQLRPPVKSANPAIIWRIGVLPERLAAINCYEFTDLSIRELLRGRIEALMISANNRDVPTFDNLVESSHYDLFCHVLLVNAERYGGSAIRAPYKEAFERRIFDIHGGELFAVNLCDLDLRAFRAGWRSGKNSNRGLQSAKPIKTPPAGFIQR